MFTIRLLLISTLFISITPFPVGAEETEARARSLINELGCKACHSFERNGSMLAPPLNRIGSQLTLQQLQEKMAEHDSADGKNFRPSYANVPAEDINTILQFLADHK